MAGAGPNAMDAPLSYVPTIMVEQMQVYRGIAPVTAGVDTLGGAVKVNMRQVALGSGFEGHAITSWQGNDDASTLAARFAWSDETFGVQGYVSRQDADEREDADGRTVRSSAYERDQYGLDAALKVGDGIVRARWQQTETAPSGTAALPMDIDYIDSKRFSLSGEHGLAGWQLKWQASYQDAEHGMDNFSQRMLMMPAMQRYTTAIGDSYDFGLSLTNAHWQLGMDWLSADHNATITNPGNAMFRVNNFKDVNDDRYSLFAQWSDSADGHKRTAGARIKFNRADAGDVMSSMAMMNDNVMALQMAFNNADRSVNDTTFDLSYSASWQYQEDLSINYGAAIKQRAPQYQARYLWLPMQASGGLADGKTYVGNINLEAETAYQLNLGLEYSKDNFHIAPQIFSQQVDDYIQGTPAQNGMVKMVASMMMNDQQPLQFNNIDAKLYGADVSWQYKVDEHWRLWGLASYVRGSRDDAHDNLYRIAPLNARWVASYRNNDWQVDATMHNFARQDRVSALNNETESPGYTRYDVDVTYHVSQQLAVRFGGLNLLDKQYTPHLAGVNRAAGGDLMVGEKLPDAGRNLYLTVDYQF